MAQASQFLGELPLARVDKAEDPEESCHILPILIPKKKKRKKSAPGKSSKANRGFVLVLHI